MSIIFCAALLNFYMFYSLIELFEGIGWDDPFAWLHIAALIALLIGTGVALFLQLRVALRRDWFSLTISSEGLRNHGRGREDTALLWSEVTKLHPQKSGLLLLDSSRQNRVEISIMLERLDELTKTIDEQVGEVELTKNLDEEKGRALKRLGVVLVLLLVAFSMALQLGLGAILAMAFFLGLSFLISLLARPAADVYFVRKACIEPPAFACKGLPRAFSDIPMSAIVDIRLGALASRLEQPLIVVWMGLNDGRSVMMLERRKGAVNLYWELWMAWHQQRGARRDHRLERPPLTICLLTRDKAKQASRGSTGSA